MTNVGPGTTRDMVMTLRAARERLGLSINEVMVLLTKNSEETGAALPSPTTVRSVLNGDLDKISGFSVDTLSPLRDVLIRREIGDPQERINVLLDVISMQEETIQRQLEELKALSEAQRLRCKKCEADVHFYKDQIAIKDRRMERKDRWIAQLLKLPRDGESVLLGDEAPGDP